MRATGTDRRAQQRRRKCDPAAADGRGQQRRPGTPAGRTGPRTGAHTSCSHQARQQVAAFEQEYQQTVAQAKQTATEAADTAALVVSTGALEAFVASAPG